MINYAEKLKDSTGINLQDLIPKTDEDLRVIFMCFHTSNDTTISPYHLYLNDLYSDNLSMVKPVLNMEYFVNQYIKPLTGDSAFSLKYSLLDSDILLETDSQKFLMSMDGKPSTIDQYTIPLSDEAKFNQVLGGIYLLFTALHYCIKDYRRVLAHSILHYEITRTKYEEYIERTSRMVDCLTAYHSK